MKHKNNAGQGQSRHSAGDTIIEVLIAIAIAGSVLAIVFATSSRNLRTTRDIQERSEASRLVQGQIESLRYAKNNSIALPPLGVPFCFKGSTLVTTFTGSVPAATLAAENFSSWPVSGDCTNNFYNFVIVQDVAPAPAGTFHIYARWDSVSISGRDEIVMVYRVN